MGRSLDLTVNVSFSPGDIDQTAVWYDWWKVVSSPIHWRSVMWWQILIKFVTLHPELIEEIIQFILDEIKGDPAAKAEVHALVLQTLQAKAKASV